MVSPRSGRRMRYAYKPEPPALSVVAFQERSTWLQVATFAIRFVGTKGGITSCARSIGGEDSAVIRIPKIAEIRSVILFVLGITCFMKTSGLFSFAIDNGREPMFRHDTNQV